MEKDKTIGFFLAKVQGLINNHLVRVVDYWDADTCAIGLEKNNKLAYISTYNYTDSSLVKYDCDFELTDNENLRNTNTTKQFRGITEDKLIDEITLFFNC